MAAYTLLRSDASAARKLLEWGEPPAQLAIRPITPRPRPSTATSRKRRKWNKNRGAAAAPAPAPP